MEICFATKRAVEEIAPLFLELEEYYFGAGSSNLDEVKKYLERQVFASHSGVRVVVAKENNQILGVATFAVLYPAPELRGQIYMKDLFTARSVRGKGVGTQLLRFIAQQAIELGCDRLDWTAETTNPKAAEFYLAKGARHVEEKQYFRFEGENLRAFAQAS